MQRLGTLYRRFNGKIFNPDDPTCPPAAKYWVTVCYRKKRKSFPLQTTSRQVAEERRREVMAPYQYNDEEHFLAALKVQGQYLVDKIVNVRDSLAIEQMWPAFLLSPAGRGQAASTQRNYRSHWGRFTAWLPANVARQRDVTPEIAKAYYEDLAQASASTHNQHISLLSMVWNALAEDGRQNPWGKGKLGRRSPEKHPHRRLSEDEVSLLVGSAPEDIRGLLLVGSQTGLRLGDVCLLRLPEIDLNREMVERVNQKTGNLSTMAMSPALVAFVRERLKVVSGDAYLMPESAVLYKRDTALFSKKMKRHFKECGVGDTSAGKASFHSLRVTVSSAFRENGIPEAVVNKWLGHAGVGTGQRHYTQIELTILKTAVQFLPRLDRVQEEVAA